MGGAGILRKTQIENRDFRILTTENRVEIDQSAGHGICMGDSGGPAIVSVNNSLQILAVNSYVIHQQNSESCSDKASATLVENYIPWIKEKLAEKNEHLKK